MDKQLVLDIAEKANYLTIDNNIVCCLHETQREISIVYHISHTTISKALKEKNVASCRLKNGEYLIIRRLIPAEL